MTVHPVGGGTHLSSAHGQGGLAKLALGLALVVAGAVLVAAAIFAVAYAVGGADATEDNWVGFVAVVGLVGGLLASLVTFAVALGAWFRHERSRLLWLPLLLFPALLAFIVLGEAFWWE
jgi:hypothetical protein